MKINRTWNLFNQAICCSIARAILLSFLVLRIFQNSFPAFTFTSNQTGTHGLDYRPIGAYGSLCRIVDPNTTCPPFEIENGFLDIDFAVSLFHPSVLYGNGALGQSEWVDDVIAFPVVRERTSWKGPKRK